MKQRKALRSLTSSILLCGLVGLAPANEGGEGGASGGATDPDGVQYVDIRPAFITNFGDYSQSSYLKAEVTLRVKGLEHMELAQYHEAAIKNAILLVLGEQTEESITSAAGKENMRKKALKNIQKVLQEEEGKAIVEDLLFTALVIQH